MTYVNHLVVTETCGTVINGRDDRHGHVSPTSRIRQKHPLQHIHHNVNTIPINAHINSTTPPNYTVIYISS